MTVTATEVYAALRVALRVLANADADDVEATRAERVLSSLTDPNTAQEIRIIGRT